MTRLNLVVAARDKMLKESDWTQSSDAILTSSEKTAWQIYRETLQDMDFSDLDNIIFPEMPPISINLPTAEQIIFRKRRKSAKENAGKAIELKGVSHNQAVDDYERRIHNGITEAILNSQIDASATVEDLKPILKNITKILCAQTKANKTLLRLLLGVADEVMPDR